MPGTRIVSYASTGSDLFVSADRRTTFALLYLPRDSTGLLGMRMGAATPVEQMVQEALAGARIDGAPFHLTGSGLLETVASGSSKGGGMSAMSMTMFGILGALVVLAFVFGSALAVVPIVMAVIAIVVTFLLVGGLTRLTEVSEIVQFVVALIGLGLAIDYSLLVIMRWRGCCARSRCCGRPPIPRSWSGRLSGRS